MRRTKLPCAQCGRTAVTVRHGTRDGIPFESWSCRVCGYSPHHVRTENRMNTWATRDPETGRHHRNAHLIELAEDDWRCLICGHHFDAAVDADLFACGDSCAGKHPGDGA